MAKIKGPKEANRYPDEFTIKAVQSAYHCERDNPKPKKPAQKTGHLCTIYRAERNQKERCYRDFFFDNTNSRGLIPPTH